MNNSKYYHNDFKKQMGIDDSRSASQKLLDKVLTNKIQRKDRPSLQEDQNALNATKKVKQLELTSNKNVFQKLMKNIKQQTSFQKLLKSLQILYKCLNDLNFVNDDQINRTQNWLSLQQVLRLSINKKNFYASQTQLIMQNTANCISVVQKNLKKILQKDPVLQSQESKIIQKIKQCLQDLQIQKIFCRLFTDDTFVFNKSLKTISNFIFQNFQTINSQQKQKTEKAYNLLLNLLQFPLKHEWIKTSISQFLKQFNVNHKQKLEQQSKSAYLKQYNIFLQKKCSTFSSKIQQSFNIMQKSSGGVVKALQIGSGVSGTQKWISKQ